MDQIDLARFYPYPMQCMHYTLHPFYPMTRATYIAQLLGNHADAKELVRTCERFTTIIYYSSYQLKPQ